MTTLNKTSLAKAIAIVFGSALGAIAFIIITGIYPMIGLYILFGLMGLAVIGMLYMFTMAVYAQIEYNNEYKYKKFKG